MQLQSRDITSFIEQTGAYINTAILSYKEVIGFVNVKDLSINKDLLFHKCEFKNRVVLENLKLSNSITFSDCIFRGGLSFSNVEKNDLGNNKVGIEISQGEVGDLSFSYVIIDRIYIQAVPKIDVVNVTESKVESIELYNNQTINSFHIYNIIVRKELSITKSKLFYNFNCRESDVKSFILSNCEFNLPVLFFYTFITDEINIYECDFKEYVSINCPTNSVDRDGKFAIVLSRFSKDLSYYFEEEKDKFLNHKKFSLINNIVNGGFKMAYLDGVIKGGDKRGFVLKELNLSLSNKNEGSYSFFDLTFENINIGGNNMKSSIELSNVNCSNIYFKKFINLGNVLMINCFEKEDLYYNKFTISGSLLNNLTFLNVNLNKFRQVDIIESSLNSIKANNTIFFDFNKLGGKGDYKKRSFIIIGLRWLIFLFFRSRNSREINFWENKREVYKQLKQSMEQNGDRIHALDFKSFEMKAHRNYLQLTKSIWNPNRIILALSSTNDYGLNWIKALMLCVITMGLFYIVLLVQVELDLGFHVNLSYSELTLKRISENLNIFFQILNPIHDVKRVFEGKQITSWTYFWDYFSRIVMSFFIFQIVSAFRKYVK